MREGVSPSASVTLAVHVRLDEVLMPVSGLMVTAVTSGARLTKVESTWSVVLPPSLSVAVAVQRITSSGSARVVESVTVFVVPSVVA